MSDKASEEISDKKSFIFDSFFFSDKAGFLSSYKRVSNTSFISGSSSEFCTSAMKRHSYILLEDLNQSARAAYRNGHIMHGIINSQTQKQSWLNS